MDKFAKIENVLKRRFFFAPTGSIYGGTAGFFDHGPLGSSLKNNMLDIWKNFFTKESNFYELETSIILPEIILKASGHVDKFCDILIFDMVNGECYRADHYLKDFVSPEEAEQLDVMKTEEIDQLVIKYNIKSRQNNQLSQATQFNLMFQTFIGPKVKNIGYLRPETAQGQFLNFKKVFEMNSSKLPLATFSIGKVFRNEISPRNGLLRVREFEQAEIEYFLHTDEKIHPKYDQVKETKLNLHFGAEIQNTHHMSLKEAVNDKIIDNECLAYFIGRVSQFLDFVGIKEYRFRQHKKDEMAHYACDCWDGELMIGGSWIECIGIADRNCYDLEQHSKYSGYNLFVKRDLKTPRKVIKYEPILDIKNWAKKYTKHTPELLEKIKNLNEAQNMTKIVEINSDQQKNDPDQPNVQKNNPDYQNELKPDTDYQNEQKNDPGHQNKQKPDSDQQNVQKNDPSHQNEQKPDSDQQNVQKMKDFHLKEKSLILKKVVEFMGDEITVEYQRTEKIEYFEDILPGVIEPSFGVGRILQGILEQNFIEREDDRTYFSFVPALAPYQVFISSLLPRDYSKEQSALLNDLISENIRANVTDQNVSIGKRYSAADEIGVSFFVTFDKETVNDQKVTIRERNKMEQIRVEIVKTVEIIKKLIKGAKLYDLGEKFVVEGSE
ncbi:Glycyl-tRNA synthetase, class II tRNA synthetase [Pseudoloma neurophilia]|uniref:glycine--tRNA ligase n=1 Tax=Pseudoloma neurophilia TaxID=146866 RepID=A0A0R0LUS7_9MICR|nr:Glycyl-tRNA synthetase, class II tRNA synthetase [Pseudoloma neurophilia]